MISVQSSIRAEVSRGAFLAPDGAEAFSAFAIAAEKGLIPEMENAAYLTLFEPMTFETLGEGLRLFQSCSLRDLVSFRKRYKDNLVACIESLLEVQPPGPSSIWVSPVGCPEVMPTESHGTRRHISKIEFSPDGYISSSHIARMTGNIEILPVHFESQIPQARLQQYVLRTSRPSFHMGPAGFARAWTEFMV
jgi:hypothetical protein